MRNLGRRDAWQKRRGRCLLGSTAQRSQIDAEEGPSDLGGLRLVGDTLPRGLARRISKALEGRMRWTHV